MELFLGISRAWGFTNNFPYSYFAMHATPLYFHVSFFFSNLSSIRHCIRTLSFLFFFLHFLFQTHEESIVQAKIIFETHPEFGFFLKKFSCTKFFLYIFLHSSRVQILSSCMHCLCKLVDWSK